MGYIVKCPQCNEVNVGSKLNCVKCQTSLIGVPRERGELIDSELTKPPASQPENHREEHLQSSAFGTEASSGSLPHRYGGAKLWGLWVLWVISTSICLGLASNLICRSTHQ